MYRIKKTKTLFKIDNISSFDNQILELKFYVNQKNLEKILLKNNLIFIKRLDEDQKQEEGEQKQDLVQIKYYNPNNSSYSLLLK